ncbi:MAG: porphobilinogen synthase [Mariprofundus sp.]|nr:porphobilinogen synthase [Mariprofundus sp.]
MLLPDPILSDPALPDLTIRPRRLRGSAALRRMVSETHLSTADLIYPLFVDETISEAVPVASMPGVSRIPLSDVGAVVKEVQALGIPGIILFGIPAEKDAIGSSGWDDNGIVQQAIRAAKAACPELCVIADTCFCEYTDHGHCGVLCGEDVDNDATLVNLQKEAVSYAQAGVDIVAPSGMMDGMIAAIRSGLDAAGFTAVPIMSYAVKYASGYFGPFRDAADSTPSFGDRASYQMDPANRREALKEAALDISEGADMLMVKPALAYMDIVREVKDATDVPMAVYNVSGEYAMVKAAAANGWIDEKRVVLETMLGFKRAGADLILTYHALDVARWLNEG